MVQMRVVTKRDGLEQALKEFPQQVEQIKTDVMEAMASEIALESPVWSGAYVTSHQVGLRSGSFSARASRESNEKISEGEAAAKRQEGYESMMNQIAALNKKSDNFVFRNPLFYASIVEGNYGVYAKARKAAVQAVVEAVQRARRPGS
jgi:hypothetical protein